MECAKSLAWHSVQYNTVYRGKDTHNFIVLNNKLDKILENQELIIKKSGRDYEDTKRRQIMYAPKIYLTVGISGAGKSHFAKRYCSAFNAVELNLDNFRKKISGDISNQNVTFEAVKLRDKELIAHLAGGHNVMLSDTNLHAKSINDIAKKFPYNDVEVFFITDSENVQLCKDRIADDIANGTDRSNVPDKVVDHQYENYMKMLDATFAENVHIHFVDTNGKVS